MLTVVLWKKESIFIGQKNLLIHFKMSKKEKKLYYAVIHNDVETVTSLLDAGVDPNKKSKFSKYKDPMLWTACEQNNLAMVKLLITHQHRPANPNVQCKNGWLIIAAIDKNNIKLVKLLLREAVIKVDLKVEVEDRIKYRICTPLMRAVTSNNIPMVKLLLEEGADPDYFPDSFATSAFMDAAKMDSVVLCKLLVEYRCNANLFVFRYRRYYSALHWAVICNKFNTVKYLLEEAKVDISQTHGTVITEAIYCHKSEILDYMLQILYRLHDDDILWYGSALHQAIRPSYYRSESCVAVLLRWGVNSVPCKTSIPHDLAGYRLEIPPRSVFWQAVEHDDINAVHLLKELYPQCLQEDWFITYDVFREHKECFEQIQYERKNPPCLDALCRTKIFQQLGYNPITKAETLPLPRKLIDFVQGKDIKGLHK